MTHGQLFKELHELRGLSQQQLAASIGCMQQNISHYETDRCLPRGTVRKAFCKALGIKRIKQ
jgi:ribosome-binding protein aMBF1 (putative translation factor)